METSRSDRLDDLRIPATATAAEAAAATAAIGSYLAEERAAPEESARSWPGRRWGFAGRLTALGFEAARVPDGVPANGWTAAGRTERF